MADSIGRGMAAGLAAAALWLGAAAPGAAEYARCKALAEAMPAELARHGKGKTTTYEQRDLGLAVAYAGPDRAQGTVYFYDAGLPRIDGGTVRAAFDGAKGDIDAVNPRRGIANPRDFADWRLDSAPVLDLAHSRSGDGRGQVVRDYLAVGQSGDCLVKLRYTVVLPAVRADRAFEGFAAAVAAAAR